QNGPNRHGGGGGGAGGVMTGTLGVSQQTYQVTIGTGGVGGISGTGADGRDSRFAAVTALGGGGGGLAGSDGREGASGGGGGEDGSGGNGSQGNDGGDGEDGGPRRSGGGGGGAVGAGANGSGTNGGAGGAGLPSNISGSSVTYAQGGSGGDGDESNNGADGANGTGNGGNGGSSNNGDGGAGGAGIVIIRYVDPAAPVAEYRMDEEEWNSSGGEVLDSTGNGGDGTAQGGATTNDASPALPGNPGTCRYGEFDGVDDYVEVAGLSNTLNATASLAFWIRTTQTGNNTAWQAPGVTGVEEGGGADDIFWGWLDGGGRIGVSVANDFSTKSTVAINNGNWRHVVLTRDHLAGTYKIYIDGNLDISGSIAAGIIGNGYSSIGRIEDTGGTPEYFAGQLDEVRIYDGVLTDADVQAVMEETHPCAAELCPAGTPQPGLIGNYYNGMTLSGGVVGTRVDGPIDFDWGDGDPGVAGIGADQFSVEWTGSVRVTETGQYLFQTESDDGVRLTVNDQLIINNWTDHASTVDTSGAVNLVAGQAYPIRLEFYENGGQAEIRLRWQTPASGSFVPVPAGPDPLGAGLYSCVVSTVSYYGIAHSGSGITCEAEPITITAYDAGDNPVAPPDGTQIVLDTLPASGTWSGGASYEFTGTENSTTKYLRQTTPATLNINITDGATTEIGTADPDITFTDVGVRFYGDTALIPLPNQVAGTLDANPVLRVVETSTDTGACVARLGSTSRDVGLAYECRNPNTCSGGQTLSLNATGVQANDAGAPIGYTNVNLAFDAQGFAAIPFSFSDVGALRLHAQLDLPAEADDPAITVAGSSSEFVVVPYTFVITTVETPGGVANPGTQAGGSGFVAAGDPFRVLVEARNQQGNITPNYGNETETATESVSLGFDSLVFPLGGDDGALGNIAAFTPTGTAGEFENSNVTWTEVGTLRVSASVADGDYLGTGDVVGVPSGDIGRFYPADFGLASSPVENACVPDPPSTPFSYMDQPITVNYTVEARNRGGAIVRNYDEGLTDPYLVADTTLHAEADNDGTDLAARLIVTPGSWISGEFVVADSGANFARDDAPDGPFANVALGVRVEDLDSADFSTLDFKPGDSNNCVADGDCDSKLLAGMLEARFGRLYAQDVHGPESSPIPMIWQTEYWNGSRFVINEDDDCSELPLSAVIFTGSTAVVDAANDTIDVTRSGLTSTFDFSDPNPMGVGDCLSPTDIGFCAGRAGVTYGPPGGVVDYPISIDLTALGWLQGDWNQDGDYDDVDHPPITVYFQHYRGHDRVIFWREVLQ
ncbi:MAG: DUF6701 domain-containing protein, partial [Cellvibrionaceae bacterium]